MLERCSSITPLVRSIRLRWQNIAAVQQNLVSSAMASRPNESSRTPGTVREEKGELFRATSECRAIMRSNLVIGSANDHRDEINRCSYRSQA